ncbi:MAG: hypothetical protein JJE52_08500 [Acidimicrobiia bacterium]|nr:hypothetical protein [Acidimicrobiia bacterium]
MKAGKVTSAVLVVDAAAADLDGADFVYDDGSRLAAVLPLTGSVPDDEYPLRTEVGEVVTVDFTTGCNPSPAELTLVALEWDVDGGVGADGKKLAAGRSSRTLADERWLRAQFAVVAGPGECGGTYPNHEQFRLSIDGLVGPPVNSYSLTLADGAGADLTFIYDVPVDASEVVLVAGADGATTHEFAVKVPELP